MINLRLSLFVLSATCTTGFSFITSPKHVTKPLSNAIHSHPFALHTPNHMKRTQMFSAVTAAESTGMLQNEASTLPELLAALWDMIVEGEEMGRGEEKTVYFPKMSSFLSDPAIMIRLMSHLDTCKDVCDDFGISILLQPKQNAQMIVEGFTVKSFSEPASVQKKVGDELDETGGYKFFNDEFWDDDFDLQLDPELLYDDDEKEGDYQTELPLPDDTGVTDDDMIKMTKEWVDTMMSNMGICPFTSGPDMAGLPLGKVFYTVDRCEKIEHVYASYWKELVRLERNNPKELSTTLLLLPEFALNNIELFENFSLTLTNPLESLKLEDLTQLVFFHPRWTFRDAGANRAGGDSASANYARRSPWPMINLLRTKQVRAAQKGIPTGLVYTQNEKTLKSIGSKDLENMLQERDWASLSEIKVNRKEHDALSMARDMQALAETEGEGVVDRIVQDNVGKREEIAAANTIAEKETEGANLVNVLKQALEKRIGGDKLNGAESSATLMATDLLIEELEKIARSV